MSKPMKNKDVKGIIKEFIRHVDELDGNDGFSSEYRSIQEEQIRNRNENAFTMDFGKADNNLRKNRYKDILPYDAHRVVLSVIDAEEDSDYINASIITGVSDSGGYIATQGPLAATVNDYWRMIWEHSVDIIFMACRIVELGKIKCKQYWNDAEKSEQFGDITVDTISEKDLAEDFVRRDFRVTKGDENRSVIQFHYSGWPDHGVPENPAHIRDLIETMRNEREKKKQRKKSPLLVHCSAGCGRTGAIIAIDYVWTLLKEGKFDENFNLHDLICDFRKQRMSIVQTTEQYELVNRVLKSVCENWLEDMSSHTYENVELNQNEFYYNEGNIGMRKTSEEESDYEYSESLPIAPPPPVQQERMVRLSGPEVVKVPLNNATTPTLPQYGNFHVQPNKKPAPQPPPAFIQNNNTPVHATYIQVNSSTGGSKDVSYKIIQPPPSKVSETSSSGPGWNPSKIVVPGGDEYSLVHKKTSGDVYSVVHKNPNKSRGVDQSASDRYQSNNESDYEIIASKPERKGIVRSHSSNTTEADGRLKMYSGANSSQASWGVVGPTYPASHLHTRGYPETVPYRGFKLVSGTPSTIPPGFTHRPPRVQGPRPIPQSWYKR